MGTSSDTESTRSSRSYRNQEIGLIIFILAMMLGFVGILLWGVYSTVPVAPPEKEVWKISTTVTETPPPVVVTETPPPVVVTVTPQARASSVSRSSRGSGNATLKCIRHHESRGNYGAVNSTGKFQGAYQLHSGYAPTWAKRAGLGQWAGTPVHKWPAAVQDAVALKLGRDTGWHAWSDHTSYSCPGF